jgi:hypothetical protein
MKHKHAELIKAWADGAKIQRCYIDCSNRFLWEDDTEPEWLKFCDYRIKPEEKKPVVRWLWAKLVLGEWLISPVFRSKEEASKTFDGEFICLEYTRTEFPE